MDSTAAVGTSMLFARQDHVHPSDTSRAPLASPTFTGDPKAPTPTAGDNDTSIATTAFVSAAVAAGGAAGAVRYDAPQTLTTPQLIQAQQNIYAAPFDAMAYSGLQINGGMEVSQERGASPTTGSYLGDGWRQFYSGTMSISAACLAAVFAPGFPSGLYMSAAVAQASIGASDYAILSHAIEGYRVARLQWGTANAQPITVAFWSNHHRTGLYTGVVRNGANNRTYAFAYTQVTADIPQYNVITIPGDTTGTWTTDNTAGLSLVFAMACGSSNIAPSANAWLAGSYAAAPGQINAVAATSDVFRLTGVTVLPGNEAPSAARSPFIMRSYDQELQTCKRYWEQCAVFLAASGTAGTGSGAALTSFSVEKRATPTRTLVGSSFNNCTFNSFGGDTKAVTVVVNVTATGTFVINTGITNDARL
jgi:hypothetical protein